MANFQKLQLIQAQYLTLDANPGNKFVFIFNFPSAGGGNWFSLTVYPMRGNNVDYGTPLPLGDNAVGISAASYLLGNLFVRKNDLRNFINQSNPSGHFDHLLFTPLQDAQQHIYYEITVVPTTVALVTTPLALNPSPPRGAS